MAAIKFFMGVVCAFVIGRSNLPGRNPVVALPQDNYSKQQSVLHTVLPVGSYKINKHEEKQSIAGGRSAQSNGAARLIEIAGKEVGVRESGHNSGPRIREYLAYVGFKEGAPWCAALISWCFGQAGLAEPRTAWSPALFPAGRLRRVTEPGMIIGIYFPLLGRIGHCGMVETVRGRLVFSIEGNTNVAGSRDGDGVLRKVRHQRSIAKVADWL